MKYIPFLFLFLPSFAIAGFWGPDTYDECLLEKMKGQSDSMIWTVQKVCERDFPYEKELVKYSDGEVKVSWSTSFLEDAISSNIKVNKTEYRVTKAEVLFSEVDCSEAKNGDFNTPKTFTYDHTGKAKLVLSRYKTSDFDKFESRKYKCMSTKSVFGILD